MTTVSWHTPTGSDPCDCPGHIEFRVREQVAAFIRSCDTEHNRGQPVIVTVGVILPNGRHLTIDCHGPENRRHFPKGAEVNWPGIGAETIDVASAFASALAFAAGVTATLASNTSDQ